MAVAEVLPDTRNPAPADLAPPDTATVRGAVRLGWYLAELRGRYWWRGTPPPGGALPDRPPHALPLRPERTPAEARRQAYETVTTLARRLVVPGLSPGEPAGLVERLAERLARLEASGAALLDPADGADVRPAPAAKDAAWEPLAALLHDWDACLQDGLAARADMLANAYLLGRGLAEGYWALGPDAGAAGPAPASAASWAFLFGDARRAELSRLVGRLGEHVNALTPAAVAGSVEAWGAVAADPGWRAADPGRGRLYEQLRRWYELLVLGRDPTTFVRPYALLHGWRTSLKAFRALLPQLLLATLSVAAVAAMIVFLTLDAGQAVLTALLGLGGVLGLTAATVAAKVKSTGQQLFARLRQDAYSDLVAMALTSVPRHPRPGGRLRFGAPTTERRVRDAVRRRRLTPATPLLDAPVIPEQRTAAGALE